MEEAIFSAQKNARSAAGIFNSTWRDRGIPIMSVNEVSTAFS
jgi:hypothetical protein